MYHATFTFVNNDLDEPSNRIKHRHVFVAEAFGLRVWLAIKGVSNPCLFTIQNLCFVEATRSVGIESPWLSRSHSDVHSVLALTSLDEAMQYMIDNNTWSVAFDAASYVVEPLTATERAWFDFEGYAIQCRLLALLESPFYGRKSTLINARMDRIRRNARIKLGLEQAREGRADYKGIRIDQSQFLRMRQHYTTLGRLVREAIKDQDAGDFDDWFADHSNTHLLGRMATAFPAIETALSNAGVMTNLELTYCEHVVHVHETCDVRENGRMRTWCESCRDDRAVWVEDQEEYWWQEDAQWSEREDGWYSYDRDSELAESDYDDDDDYHAEEEPNRLMSYMTVVTDYVAKDTSFTPSPFGDFLMGVELEMATEGSVGSAVESVRAALGEDYCVCKSDGSLPRGGFEVVTAPRKLDEHIKCFGSWFSEGIPSNFSAWDREACGMHVHIDSRAFTAMTLGKFLMLINSSTNVDFIRRIAGRHPSVDKQARDYCAAEEQDILDNPKHAIKGKSTRRYRMVNTTCLKRSESDRLGVQYVGERSFNTIELRIFRASLKRERLLAQIEFTHAAVMFCRVASYRDLDYSSFIKWLRTTNNTYPNLADWYGVRRRATAKNSAPTELACVDRV
tara:strand:- start:320 stop:2185 length:1866 start_codon:yes stop_codon:yes gene_type:complete